MSGRRFVGEDYENNGYCPDLDAPPRQSHRHGRQGHSQGQRSSHAHRSSTAEIDLHDSRRGGMRGGYDLSPVRERGNRARRHDDDEDSMDGEATYGFADHELGSRVGSRGMHNFDSGVISDTSEPEYNPRGGPGSRGSRAIKGAREPHRNDSTRRTRPTISTRGSRPVRSDSRGVRHYNHGINSDDCVEASESEEELGDRHPGPADVEWFLRAGQTAEGYRIPGGHSATSGKFDQRTRHSRS